MGAGRSRCLTGLSLWTYVSFPGVSVSPLPAVMVWADFSAMPFPHAISLLGQIVHEQNPLNPRVKLNLSSLSCECQVFHPSDGTVNNTPVFFKSSSLFFLSFFLMAKPNSHLKYTWQCLVCCFRYVLFLLNASLTHGATFTQNFIYSFNHLFYLVKWHYFTFFVKWDVGIRRVLM